MSILSKNNIKLLSDFSEIYANKYYERFYLTNFPKIVLCGINPGRLGAGKTGIPFMDFNSLSKIFPGINRNDSERSANFIFKIIENFGFDIFFKNFYITNFSFFGFIKGNNNLNYFKLPQEAIDIIFDYFVYEMEIIKPKYIISLSMDVFDSINSIKNLQNINKTFRLAHPYYCSFISREKKYLYEYLTTLKNILQTV